MRSDETVSRHPNWIWPCATVDPPRWEHFTVAALTMSTVASIAYALLQLQYYTRNASFTSSFVSNDMHPWNYTTTAFTFTAAAPQVSHFVDDYSRPELAPFQHGSFVWSSQELMGSMGSTAMAYESEHADVV